MNFESSFRKYAPFWSKYRPAILKMMQADLNEWQQYQLMKHELTAIDQKPKGGFNFRLVISMNRPTRDSSNSEIAKDFINMLRLSQTGMALMSTNQYEIILDKTQMLRISRQSIQ
jgi:hypothetical protein